jgi:hypothetical protein
MSLMPLSCMGLDGIVRTFYFDVVSETSPDGNEWKYQVHLHNPPRMEEDDFYYAAFRQIGDARVQVVMLSRNKAHYGGKGITEALFAEVAHRTSLQLVSSTNRKSGSDEYRTVQATRVWNRLVEAKKATYDAASDHYVLL